MIPWAGRQNCFNLTFDRERFCEFSYTTELKTAPWMAFLPCISFTISIRSTSSKLFRFQQPTCRSRRNNHRYNRASCLCLRKKDMENETAIPSAKYDQSYKSTYYIDEWRPIVKQFFLTIKGHVKSKKMPCSLSDRIGRVTSPLYSA